uniref:Uncharacterized protein n=1 Tax=Ascaris lumbricoides TaxID=6252 RepID=A0A0M3IGS0_ASCLU
MSRQMWARNGELRYVRRPPGSNFKTTSSRFSTTACVGKEGTAHIAVRHNRRWLPIAALSSLELELVVLLLKCAKFMMIAHTIYSLPEEKKNECICDPAAVMYNERWFVKCCFIVGSDAMRLVALAGTVKCLRAMCSIEEVVDCLDSPRGSALFRPLFTFVAHLAATKMIPSCNTTTRRINLENATVGLICKYVLIAAFTSEFGWGHGSDAMRLVALAGTVKCLRAMCSIEEVVDCLDSPRGSALFRPLFTFVAHLAATKMIPSCNTTTRRINLENATVGLICKYVLIAAFNSEFVWGHGA